MHAPLQLQHTSDISFEPEPKGFFFFIIIITNTSVFW